MRIAALALTMIACSYSPPRTSGDDVGVDAGPGDDAGDDSGIDAAPTVVLSQNLSLDAISGHSVFCQGAALGRDNAWARRFVVADFGVMRPFEITSVHFAVELAFGGPPVTVEIYDYAGTANGSTLSTFANLLASKTVAVPDVTTPQNIVVPISAAVVAPQAFIVSVSSTDTQNVQGTPLQTFHLGGNTAGETARGYWSSTTCGVNTPTSQIDNVILAIEGRVSP